MHRNRRRTSISAKTLAYMLVVLLAVAGLAKHDDAFGALGVADHGAEEPDVDKKRRQLLGFILGVEGKAAQVVGRTHLRLAQD